MSQALDHLDFFAHAPDRHIGKVYLCFLPTSRPSRSAFATLVAYCLIDLVIVDWIVLCWWRPSWIVVRGTEEAEGWGDYLFHVREQLSPKGLAAMFGLPLVIAGAATATRALL